MSPYSSDVDNRIRVYIALWVLSAVIAFAISYTANVLIQDTGLAVQFIVFMLSLSPMAICILFIDHLPQNYLLKLSGIDNLTGKYEGILKSSYDQFQDEHQVTVKIVQTMKTINISLSTRDSESYNTSAFINSANGKTVLTYTYRNKGSAEKSLTQHDGTCTLSFNESSVTGEYYTSHDRKNYGTLILSRQRKNDGQFW